VEVAWGGSSALGGVWSNKVDTASKREGRDTGGRFEPRLCGALSGVPCGVRFEVLPSFFGSGIVLVASNGVSFAPFWSGGVSEVTSHMR
jgi:hypothetical protein